MVSVYAQSQQVLPLALRLFPIVPNAIAQPVSYPAIYVPQFALDAVV
jgi:hypothetical protein